MKVLTTPFFGPDQTYQSQPGFAISPVQDGAGLWIVGTQVLTSPFLQGALNQPVEHEGETKPLREWMVEVDYTDFPVVDELPAPAPPPTPKRRKK
jgi:hypothetical protein